MSFWAQAYSKACARKSSPAIHGGLISAAASRCCRGVGELDAVVGQHGVDLVGDGRDQVRAGSRRRPAWSPSRAARRRRTSTSGRWRRRGRACPARSAPRRCRCGSSRSDRLLNFRLSGLSPSTSGSRRDAMALQAAVQRRARQVRDRRLQGVEAVVERQQRMPAEGDDDRLLLDRQHGRLGPPSARSADRRPRSALFHLATVFGLIP